jgi:hypothetical protein
MATGPLGEQHLVMINDALEKLKDAQEQVDRARRAGIDVQPHADKIAEADTKLRQIKQVYFPNR